ncbi:MAG: hypothetical protein IPF58_10385 [Saprospirales bacterium]|nr:hypothetical protein [Saprospirales bacterium]
MGKIRRFLFNDGRKLKQEIVKIPVPDYIKSNDPMYKNGVEFASNNLENYKNYIELVIVLFMFGTTGL